MNKKSAQVVMLPQDKDGWNKGDLVDVTTRSMIPNPVIAKTNSGESPDIMDCKAQHLYFISTDPNEEIKEGEICLRDYGMGHELVTYKSEYGNTCRKIIASTDQALGLPIVPLTWIRDVYVPSNGSIKEVMLETEEVDILVTEPIRKYYNETKLIERFKLTPDNEVCITDWHDGKVWNEIWLGEPQPCILGSNSEVVITDIPKEFTEAKEWAEKVNQTLNWSDNESVGEELKNAAKQHITTNYPHYRLQELLEPIFIAGANWKAEQVANDSIDSDKLSVFLLKSIGYYRSDNSYTDIPLYQELKNALETWKKRNKK